MAIKVIVFDLDGTLIDSNQLKYDAFFKLFPFDAPPPNIIEKVLDEFLEESRYVILREILKRVDTETINENELDNRVLALATKYNDLIVGGAKQCNEKPGAKEVLELFSKRYKLYLSSTTPEASLKEIVKHRNWNGFFCDLFGFPNDKTSVLLNIIKKESVNPDELLVVGDGKSDRNSANSVKCKYFRISNDSSLMALLDLNLKTTNLPFL
jgi:phosphoglycolate phosphatase-like HAD superfamily hydrolase